MNRQTLWPENAAHEPFAYFTTIGRVSGEPHRIEIWFAVESGRVYLLSGGRDRSDWVRNLMENPVITLEAGGEKRAGVAQVLEAGSAADQLARKLLVAKYQKNDELMEWGKNSLGVIILFGIDEQTE